MNTEAYRDRHREKSTLSKIMVEYCIYKQYNPFVLVRV